MPQDLAHYIEVTLGGTDILFVSQKRVTATDVDPNHTRVLLPRADTGFLNEEESAALGVRAVPVQVVDPHQLEHPRPDLLRLDFRRWELRTGGKATTVYLLTTAGWARLVEDNKLAAGDEIKIWSFRVESRLHMAVVVDKRAPRPLLGRLIGV